MQSHFSPGYAYPTYHPYAQYSGNVTYPGPSIMGTTSGALATGLASIASLVTIFGGWMWLSKKTNYGWIVKLIIVLLASPAMAGIFGFLGKRLQGQQL